jgi:uncharacterized protein (DUF1810 family)
MQPNSRVPMNPLSVDDPFAHFVEAQNKVYDAVIEELTAGKKETHWMWYIFPQLKGLGHSLKSVKYGLDSPDHATAYLDHGVTGPRLIGCTKLVLAHQDKSAEQIFGTVDRLKFWSCMTLFSSVPKVDGCFAQALGQFFGGEKDSRTLDMLALDGSPEEALWKRQ